LSSELPLPVVQALRAFRPRAVAVLFVMDLTIAVVTYNCLVRIARTRQTG
jgi:hypothetical protein